MELQYLLTDMEATAVVGYVEIERAANPFRDKHTFYAYDTNRTPIFRRKGDPTLITKVANGKGMRVMALGYFGIGSEWAMGGMSAPEIMRLKMEARAS